MNISKFAPIEKSNVRIATKNFLEICFHSMRECARERGNHTFPQMINIFLAMSKMKIRAIKKGALMTLLLANYPMTARMNLLNNRTAIEVFQLQ